MVLIEAAAIGAASYGLYKGGEVGVQKGSEYYREMQRGKKRASQLSKLREKTRLRSNRIAEIIRMKRNGGIPSESSSRFNTARGSGAITSRRASFAERQIAEKEANADIDRRQRTVMQKLRSNQQEERKKSSKWAKKLLSFNLIKKNII